MTCEEFIRRRNRLRRELSENPSLREIRIAVLGGVTTNEVVGFLEVLLLAENFRPVFFQSEYNKYFETAVLETEALREFRPDFVFVHTHWVNIRQYPPPGADEAAFQEILGAELSRFRQIWTALAELGCQIVQNNFETPPLSLLGNSDCVSYEGRTRFLWDLNLAFARAAQENSRLVIQDLNSLAASLGHVHWFDWARWYSYKIPTTPEASVEIASSLAAIVGAVLGRSKKCLVLDLDNTLWGGVIGDDGADKIQIGKETAVAEAYTAFQEYCLALRQRGVLLAVCSKNEDATARAGFSHPDSVLQLEHFSAFKANWEPKHRNIEEIAAELNLGLDSFVFVDDNPAERELVRAQLPQVLTPEVGDDVSLYPSILQATRCFEAIRLSREDLQRAASYAANAARATMESKFASYDEYLASLQMTAEIDLFRPVYLDRITQLTNKTNQFNLTTRRYTYAEVEQISLSSDYLPLYCKLTDVFGDNGLISVIVGRREERVLHLDLWLMSCRVLKRDVELAMLDALVECARERGIQTIVGYYYPTPKNAMVRDHYRNLGFAPDAGGSAWSLDVRAYAPRNRHISVSRKLAQVTS